MRESRTSLSLGTGLCGCPMGAPGTQPWWLLPAPHLMSVPGSRPSACSPAATRVVSSHTCPRLRVCLGPQSDGWGRPGHRLRTAGATEPATRPGATVPEAEAWVSLRQLLVPGCPPRHGLLKGWAQPETARTLLDSPGTSAPEASPLPPPCLEKRGKWHGCPGAGGVEVMPLAGAWSSLRSSFWQTWGDPASLEDTSASVLGVPVPAKVRVPAGQVAQLSSRRGSRAREKPKGAVVCGTHCA